MALDGCGIICKYILILFNFIFALLGFAFLGLGLWLRFSASTRGIFGIDFLNSYVFVMAVTTLIVLGLVMLTVVSFGDYGACNEKRCALQTFSGLVAFLFVATVAIGAVVYLNQSRVVNYIVEFYINMYTLYVDKGGDPVVGLTLTFIHKTLHCCGVTGIPLVELAKHTCPEPDGFFQHIIMPNCPEAIASTLRSNSPVVMGIFFGTGALLMTAMVCAAILHKQLKRGRQEMTAYYTNVY